MDSGDHGLKMNKVLSDVLFYSMTSADLELVFLTICFCCLLCDLNDVHWLYNMGN